MKIGCVVLMGLFSAAALAQTAQSVTVAGEVLNPGTFAIQPTGLTLMQAIALSRGFTQDASQEIEILRRTPGVAGETSKPIIFRVNFKDVMIGKTANVKLEPGDELRISKVPAADSPLIPLSPKPSTTDRI